MAKKLFYQPKQSSYFGLYIPVISGLQEHHELLKHIWFLRDNRPFHTIIPFFCENSTQVYFTPPDTNIVDCSSSIFDFSHFTTNKLKDNSTWYSQDDHKQQIESQSSLGWHAIFTASPHARSPVNGGQYPDYTAYLSNTPFFIPPNVSLTIPKGANLLNEKNPFQNVKIDLKNNEQNVETETLIPVFAYPFNITRQWAQIFSSPEGLFQCHIELDYFSLWTSNDFNRTAITPQTFADQFYHKLINYTASCPFIILTVDVCNIVSLCTFLLAYNMLVFAYNNNAICFEGFPPCIAIILINTMAADSMMATEMAIQGLFQQPQVQQWDVHFYNYGNLFPAHKNFKPPKRRPTPSSHFTSQDYESAIAKIEENMSIYFENEDLTPKQHLAAFLDSLLISTLQKHYIPVPSFLSSSSTLLSPSTTNHPENTQIQHDLEIKKPLIPFPGKVRGNFCNGILRQPVAFSLVLPHYISSPVKFPLRTPTRLPSHDHASSDGTWYTVDDDHMTHWCLFDYDHTPLPLGQISSATTLMQALQQDVTHQCVGLRALFGTVYSSSSSTWKAHQIISLLQSTTEIPKSSIELSNSQNTSNFHTPKSCLETKKVTYDFLTIPYRTSTSFTDIFPLPLPLATTHNEIELKQELLPKKEPQSWFSRFFGTKSNKPMNEKFLLPSARSSFQIHSVKQSFRLTEGLPIPYSELSFLNHSDSLIKCAHKNKFLQFNANCENDYGQTSTIQQNQLCTSFYNSPTNSNQFYTTTMLDSSTITSLLLQRDDKTEGERKALISPFFADLTQQTTSYISSHQQSITSNSPTILEPPTPLSDPYHFNITCSTFTNDIPISNSIEFPQNKTFDYLLFESLFYCSIVTTSQIITALHLCHPKDNEKVPPIVISDSDLEYRFVEYDQDHVISNFMAEGRFSSTRPLTTVLSYPKENNFVHVQVNKKWTVGNGADLFTPPNSSTKNSSTKSSSTKSSSTTNTNTNVLSDDPSNFVCNHYGTANKLFDYAKYQPIPHFYLVIDDRIETGSQLPSSFLSPPLPSYSSQPPNLSSSFPFAHPQRISVRPEDWTTDDAMMEKWFLLHYPSTCRTTVGNQVNEYFYSIVNTNTQDIQDAVTQFMKLAIAHRMESFESL